MPKVWALQGFGPFRDDGNWICGVYSTEEKANYAKLQKEKEQRDETCPDTYEVDEMNVE